MWWLACCEGECRWDKTLSIDGSISSLNNQEGGEWSRQRWLFWSGATGSSHWSQNAIAKAIAMTLAVVTFYFLGNNQDQPEGLVGIE